MKDNKQRPDANESRRPERQTGEEHGSVKSRQSVRNERSDTPRGSEPETRAAGGRRG